MRDVFDIYTIIFLALAVFIFLRLRSVLGQRTGRERPPYDPYSARDARAPTSDKVVALPGRKADAAALEAEAAEPADRWRGIAEHGSAVAKGLDAIAAADTSFERAFRRRRAALTGYSQRFCRGDRPRARASVGARSMGFEAALRERERRPNAESSSSLSTRRNYFAKYAVTRRRSRALCFAIVPGRANARECCGGQPRQNYRGHRRVDLRARFDFARSQLETCGDRSRTMILARSPAMRVLTRALLVISTAALVASGASAKPADKVPAQPVAKATAKPASKATAEPASKSKSVAKPAPRPPVLKIAGSQIEPLAFVDIDGWAADDHAAAFAAFMVSCKAILKSSPKMRASRPLMYRALYDSAAARPR